MKNRKRFWLVRSMLLLIIVGCLLLIGKEIFSSLKQKSYQKDLRETLEAGQNHTEQSNAEAEIKSVYDSVEIEKKKEIESSLNEETAEVTIQEQTIMDKFKDLYEQNSDLIGWLSIPETVIDYPVMQCGDNEYYLHHNFDREEDKYGCLFVKDIADVNTPGTNFIIYGHNMKDGSMFGALDKYREKTFYEDHSEIIFNTLNEERQYTILAVFLSHVYKSNEEGFRYYQFYQADTEDEFRLFYENIMDMALYKTGVTAEFGDTFLTLSTCAYHEEDGRLVVVARRSDYLQ